MWPINKENVNIMKTTSVKQILNTLMAALYDQCKIVP